MARRTNDQIRKDNYNNEVNLYKWYVVNISEKKAISGFEYKEDAADLLLDYGKDKNYKVVAKSALKRIGIEIPNENWKYKTTSIIKSNVLLIRYNNLIDTYSKQKTRANILAQYTSNEISNEHTKNIVLMTFHFGNVKENLLARKVYVDYEKSGNAERTASRIKAEKLANKFFYELKNQSINKSKTMATEKQLAARKRFAAAAKNGTLAKQRAAADKTGLGAPAKRKTITAKKLCSKVIRREGLKLDGTLKKGYHYTPGGKVVKAAPKKKVTAKKKVVAKKATAKKPARKKFLGIF